MPHVVAVRAAVAAAALLTAVTTVPAAFAAPAAAGATASRPTVGASGDGDRFFPLAGNGGYDVSHYDI
jgi:hypothetical protein